MVIPFYAASVVETVQSDIASEKPGIFDVFQEGISRFLSWSAPQTGELKMHLKRYTVYFIILIPFPGRLLPIWIILCPAVLCGTVHYITSVLVSGLTRWGLVTAKKRRQRKQVSYQTQEFSQHFLEGC